MKREKIIPAAGEQWALHIDGDPFPSRYGPVTILEVKEGWVRYSFRSVFLDERKPLESFLNIYKKVLPLSPATAAAKE